MVAGTHGRCRRILLKNSNFRGDHNSEDRWQPRWKFPWGLSGATDLFAYDPLLALAVARTRGDSAFRAEVGFSLHLNFRLFQQYRRKAAIAGRENGRRKLGGERVFRESDSTFIGDWNIPLGVVVFVTTLGREAAGNNIDVAARV
jgi:hypothetical protein